MREHDADQTVTEHEVQPVVAPEADTARGESRPRQESRRASRSGLSPEGVEWTPVSPKLIPAELLSGALVGLFWLAVTSVPLILRLTGVWPGYPAWLAWGLPAVVLVWALVDLALVPRRTRALGYAEREDDLLLRSGLLFRRVAAVPYGRLQYLDITEGPIQRRFGIRTLEFQTASASTDVSLPGIPVAESKRLREELLARSQARLAGL